MIGSFAQAMAATIVLIASWFLDSMAFINATAGVGFIPDAVAQQAVVVLGDSAKNSCTAISFGTKLMRPPVATISSLRPFAREYLAEVTVGAAFATAPQNSKGKAK